MRKSVLEICKVFKNTYFEEHLRTAAADVYYSHLGAFGHFGASEQISHNILHTNLVSFRLTLSIYLPSQHLLVQSQQRKRQ